MPEIPFSELIKRSFEIRKRYHKLERLHHKSTWTVEEDALAFLSDAGLVGRLTMAQQGRWPISDEDSPDLKHKLGECMWWLIVLAERMNVDIHDALQNFVVKTESHFSEMSSEE